MNQKTYRITTETLAILSMYDMKYQSKIIEMTNDVFVKEPPFTIIKTNCLFGGSSYNGRMEAVKYYLDFQQKIPVPIYPTERIYAFPTKSPNDISCIWLFWHAIQSIQTNPYGTQAHLVNNETITITLAESQYSIQKQYERTGMCMVIFNRLG
ncbi:competence protein ComK [Gracilibacillus orientalis]|uniref:Competence protein ComK n=1 Tax=Gracilibacillus orientalis TaxID=334253 RepID=A0A1I4PD44_9BACI|nr:competence protein ComK [Gracilibacillus orientalis]SFM25691.1 competence protein ComK [Gracilibacillus orientalis]